MLGMFKPNNNQVPPPQTEMQERAHRYLTEALEMVPVMFRPMLTPYLAHLSILNDDDNLIAFIAKARGILDDIEYGEMPFADEDEGE